MSSQDLCDTQLEILSLFDLLRKSVAARLRVLNWTAGHLIYANHFVGPSLKAIIVNFTDREKNDSDTSDKADLWRNTTTLICPI